MTRFSDRPYVGDKEADKFVADSDGNVAIRAKLSGEQDLGGAAILNEASHLGLATAKPFYRLNGVADLISITDNAQLDPGTEDYTYSVWFDYPDVSGDVILLSRFVDNQNRMFMEYDQSLAKVNFYWQTSNTVRAQASFAFTPTAGTRYNIVWSITNGSANAVYVNAVAQTLTTDTTTGGDMSLAAALQAHAREPALHVEQVEITPVQR